MIYSQDRKTFIGGMMVVELQFGQENGEYMVD